jgi:hypothetical protein
VIFSVSFNIGKRLVVDVPVIGTGHGVMHPGGVQVVGVTGSVGSVPGNLTLAAGTRQYHFLLRIQGQERGFNLSESQSGSHE